MLLNKIIHSKSHSICLRTDNGNSRATMKIPQNHLFLRDPLINMRPGGQLLIPRFLTSTYTSLTAHRRQTHQWHLCQGATDDSSNIIDILRRSFFKDSPHHHVKNHRDSAQECCHQCDRPAQAHQIEIKVPCESRAHACDHLLVTTPIKTSHRTSSLSALKHETISFHQHIQGRD